MESMPYKKYTPYPPVELPGRIWPSRQITKAPVWCSIDLRDGNQALSEPMDVERKMTMFRLLAGIGFREIEAGFPSASETEFRFIRKLIEEDLIPQDVTIQVLTQARPHLIKRTFEAVAGCKRAIVHVYNPTSPCQREVVFRMDRQAVKDLAISATKMVSELSGNRKGGNILYEYTPESFTATELDFAAEVCNAVIDAWDPAEKAKMIINLPSTVEMSTPNVYADRIEWMCRSIKRRGEVMVSVHTHNDRGTAVASAELAVLAGAERVEGALFGNGERCGNMDIITMAMNLFSRGINPELDFSRIDHIKEVYSQSTGMDVHPRHPYAGDLVFTAFSGSHQDAINKGLRARESKSSGTWDVPYLPVDPADFGRSYEAIIRVNSQSGKGGAAHVLERDFGIVLPKWIQPDFGREVQKMAEASGRELLPSDVMECFNQSYIRPADGRINQFHLESDRPLSRLKISIAWQDKNLDLSASGNGPLDAFVKGLKEAGITLEIVNYTEYALARGSDSLAIAFSHTKSGEGKESFGAGVDANISIASIKAVISALTRLKID